MCRVTAVFIASLFGCSPVWTSQCLLYTQAVWIKPLMGSQESLIMWIWSSHATRLHGKSPNSATVGCARTNIGLYGVRGSCEEHKIHEVLRPRLGQTSVTVFIVLPILGS